MASEINPSLTPTKSLSSFRFWCQKVLPLVYDDSLSYYEVLGKMVVQLNDVIDDVNADTENVLTLKDAFLELQTYVNEFFDDIDQLASYAERAEEAQTAANQSAINAASSASNASASSLAAMNARDAAVTAKEAAEASANTASTASTNATTKASEAAQSAITAQTAQASASQSATLAATDRSAAQTAANTATAKAIEANTSASNAAESEDNVEALVNTVRESIDNIQQNTQDVSKLKETVSELTIHNTIDSRYPQFSAIKNSETKIVLDTGYIQESIQSLRLNWFYTNLFDFNTVQFYKDLNDTGDVVDGVATRFVSDFIDVSTYNSLTYRILYGWTASHRNRVCGYNSNKEFVRLLWSNGSTNRDQTVTIDVTDIAYIRISSTGRETWIDNDDIVIAITPDFNDTVITLDNFFGGIIDFTNGVATNKYTASGESTEIQTQITPIDFTTKNKNYVFANRYGYYFTVTALSIDFNETPKSYIDEKINQTQKIIAGIETSMKATKSYSVGDILIAEDTLYKVIAPISRGAELTVNTNVTATTVAEQLIALANI